MSYRDYSTSKGHIVDASGFGDFTTIQAAINAAVSGQDIFVSAGTYTEDITLIAGINVRASLGDSVTPIVKITGNLTYTGVGNATISGARLTTNSNFLITVSGSNASVLHVINCDLHCTNNTGISFTNSNAASQILLEQCTGNLTTTGIAYHTSSSAGTLAYRYSTFNNTGASTTASTNSAGSVVWSYGAWLSPISCSSTGTMEGDYFLNDCSAINTTTITTAGSGTSLFRDCIFLSGTASTISVGTGSTVDLYGASIRSSNTNAITGAGTIKYTEVGFTGTSSTINTTTQTPIPLTVQQGGTNATSFTQSNGIVTYNGTSLVNYAGPQIDSSGRATNTTQPAFLYYLASSTGNVTGDGTVIQIGTATLTKKYDNDSNCTTGGVFTAPVTGTYQLFGTVNLANTEAATADSYVFITAGGTDYYGTRWNYTNATLTSGVCHHTISVAVQLTATNTAVLKVQCAGGASKGVAIGGSSSLVTYFGGYLIC